jgi:hypothetical protein
MHPLIRSFRTSIFSLSSSVERLQIAQALGRMCRAYLYLRTLRRNPALKPEDCSFAKVRLQAIHQSTDLKCIYLQTNRQMRLPWMLYRRGKSSEDEYNGLIEPLMHAAPFPIVSLDTHSCSDVPSVNDCNIFSVDIRLASE